MMRRLGVLLACLLVSSSAAQAATGTAVGATAKPKAQAAVTLLRDTQLDPTALYFVSYDGLVNNESFQQDAILT